MAKPQLMHQVDDDILKGNVERNRGQCGNCGHYTMVIHIQEIFLGDVEPSSRLIFCDSDDNLISHIGIGCGCYARAHRQFAHIADARRR